MVVAILIVVRELGITVAPCQPCHGGLRGGKIKTALQMVGLVGRSRQSMLMLPAGPAAIP